MIALILCLTLPFTIMGMVMWQMARPSFGISNKILAQFAAAWLCKTPKGKKIMRLIVIDWLLLVGSLIWWHYG